MRIVLDIETNSLKNPKHIWVVVCKDIDTGEYQIFRKVTDDPAERDRFLSYVSQASMVVGHNILEFDLPVLADLIGYVPTPCCSCLDTLILSKLTNYSRVGGHSLESYGDQFKIAKLKFNDFTKYSLELEAYCQRDVEINWHVFNHFVHYVESDAWASSIKLEHEFQLVVNSLHRNGFAFDVAKATKLLTKVQKELEELDAKIRQAFLPKLRLVREIYPKLTRHGTLHRGDFRWVKGVDLTEYNGGPFCRCSWEVFNPSSHKQVIDVLHQAGWAPTDRTSTHTETIREINRLKYRKGREKEIDTRLQELYNSLTKLEKYGYRINETNLASLPDEAPSPARLLARRILIESRRRTLVEWLGLVQEDNRIHGKFSGIGAWTHRMAHQQPNTANIPTDAKLYGKEMRSLWRAAPKRLLVGVDAEGIQLRIFAHYVNDPELIRSLINGRKEDKTDPHSLNQRVIGPICKTRAAAKRFLYALLLGGGVGKFAQILECTKDQAQTAFDTFRERYPGYDLLRREQFPIDAEKGYFVGLDGREVRIPGSTVGDRKHLAMSGYLQNGEAIIMKRACLKWHAWLKDETSNLVNFVHDEWQTECPNNMAIALRVAARQALSLREVGEDLRLNCPLAGSYWSEDHNDYTIGTTWAVTH